MNHKVLALPDARASQTMGISLVASPVAVGYTRRQATRKPHPATTTMMMIGGIGRVTTTTTIIALAALSTRRTWLVR